LWGGGWVWERLGKIKYAAKRFFLFSIASNPIIFNYPKKVYLKYKKYSAHPRFWL
jgi:hypothetical protein